MTDARDIVERLNADADRWMAGDVGRDNEGAGLLSDEAAKTITSLRKQLEEARDNALEEAAVVAAGQYMKVGNPDFVPACRNIAVAIRKLKGQQHG